MEQSEDAVYDAFNEANTIAEYRTHCSVEKNSIGEWQEHVWRWHQHICKPEFVNAATSTEAQAIVMGWPYKPASMAINAVTGRYEALWKAKFAGEWLVWD